MFFNFDYELTDAMVEQYIGNELANNQRIQAPMQMLQMQFMQLVQQIASQKQPMKVKLIVPYQVWSQYDKEMKILNNYIEFQNQRDD